jgi:hypothetical protein
MSFRNLHLRSVHAPLILGLVLILPMLAWAQDPTLRAGQYPRYPNGSPYQPPTEAQVREWHCETPLVDQSSVTAAYRSLYQAVKCQAQERIRNALSRATIEFMTAAARMQKKSLDQALVNGTIESNLSNTLPILCSERVKGDWGALEINGNIGRWEDIPFVLEDGKWKVAIGDIFNGTYQKPSDTICTPPPSAERLPAPPAGIFAPATKHKHRRRRH